MFWLTPGAEEKVSAWSKPWPAAAEEKQHRNEERGPSHEVVFDMSFLLPGLTITAREWYYRNRSSPFPVWRHKLWTFARNRPLLHLSRERKT